VDHLEPDLPARLIVQNRPPMRRAFIAVAVAGLLAVPALAADHTISAGPAPLTFAEKDVTIDQGDTLTFRNDDSSGAKHDVTADGDKPLFESDTIDAGKSAPVEGVEFLKTGDYPFHCSVHPFMKGTLHVTANGTPQSGPPPDTIPPSASVAIADSKISAVLERRALRVALTSNEPSRFKLSASSGRTTIAKGTLTLTGTKRTGAISLTRAGRRLLGHARRITVRLRASVNDAAGNRSAASATRKLR
jgi:plastocyanin